MRSARPSRGAISTAPDNVTMSAVTLRSLQEALERERVGGRDAFAGERPRAFVAEPFGHRQRQAAAAEVERAQLGEAGARDRAR